MNSEHYFLFPHQFLVVQIKQKNLKVRQADAHILAWSFTFAAKNPAPVSQRRKINKDAQGRSDKILENNMTRGSWEKA